ncbi:MAG: T9SS type A sorting domain-containing protein [Bacteroidales bacterium]|nr:T9SS type A sorting domain-containing protein [Bacteroidales bacterium]
MMDNAIITFNEGNQLGKFYFGTQNANIYLPQNGQDYAIAFSDKQAEMQLNFKAAKDGEYTLTIHPEDAELSFLHLIDNITGANVDLLQTPVYTFDAKTSDYASRFKLVFTGKVDNPDDHDDFAFISNGEIIVLGEGTLQIFDVLGRNITSVETSYYGVSTNGMAPGIYVLRLIDGEKVRVQKIMLQ